MLKMSHSIALQHTHTHVHLLSMLSMLLEQWFLPASFAVPTTIPPTQAVATLVGLSVIRLVTAGPMTEAGEPSEKKDALFNYSPAVSPRAGMM